MKHLKCNPAPWWRRQQAHQGQLHLARFAPAAATVNPRPVPTSELPQIARLAAADPSEHVVCTMCPAKVAPDTVDDHGRCVSCSAVAASIEMIRAAEQDEADRIDKERHAQQELAAATRGAGSLPRLPDEPAPAIAFAAHATEVLPELAEELDAEAPAPEQPHPADPTALPMLDFVALGYVAAAADDDDATLRAQIMLSERHDVPGLMTGIAAGLSAFTARQDWLAYQAAQKALVTA